jgi:phosphoglycerate dehydrogenase-like enzyme
MLKRAGFEINLIENDRFPRGHASDEEEIELLQGASAVIAAGERYTRKVIESLPDLRSIARLGVGFDRVDVPAATANDVVLTITPNSNHEAVAEHAFALIMAVAKSIVSKDKAMRAGEWPTRPLMPIRGATLGIVGLGRIGRDLAVRALAMKMNVLAAEPQPDMDFVHENGIQLLDLDALLKSSDYVSLNCALSEETRGLINRHKLALMKPTAALINTARGGLIVEADLIEALKSGQMGGAGLDVFELEPTDPDNQLYTMDNVVVSPHMAGNDVLSVEDMGNEAAQCVIDLFNGRWPDGAVVNNELKGRWSW